MTFKSKTYPQVNGVHKEIPLSVFCPVEIQGLARLGNRYDGGYIVHMPSLKDAVALVNYGVGYNVVFEKDFFRSTGLCTLAFDPTLNDISLLFSRLQDWQLIPFFRHLKNILAWPFQQRSLARSRITFIEEGIADSNRRKYKTLRYHLEKYGLLGKKIILKIDTEGAEYSIFKDGSIYPLIANCVQIVAEFHHVDQNMEALLTIMQRLGAKHSPIHIHANNHEGTFLYRGKNIPKIMEITFLANSYITEKRCSRETYPIAGLDQPCHKNRKDIELDFFY